MRPLLQRSTRTVRRSTWLLHRSSTVALTVGLGLGAGGCATTRYQPRVVARGELTLRYDGGYEAWANGRKVASGISWGGLPDYVRCVPPAKEHADSARSRGAGAVITSILAVVGGAGGVSGIVGAGLDDKNSWPWLGGGVLSAVGGLVFGGVSQALKSSANGHAIDALNYYNDQVGSLGATCDDLTYPPPAGPLPPPPPDAPPAPADAPPPPPDAPPPQQQ